jgi:hypothetical protein
MEENWLENNLKKHALALASLKRTIACLRSRIGWLQDGDANTRLFHLHSWHRKRKNFIAKIVIVGHTLTNHDDKANAMFEYYENLLGISLDRTHSINLQELGINSHNLADLDMPFSVEVWATVKRILSDKAPEPDGFTGRFYKTC